MVGGTDFPSRPDALFDLVIHCGACMFNRKYVLSRIERVREQHIPMTNYGVAIAFLNGILDQIEVLNPGTHERKSPVQYRTLAIYVNDQLLNSWDAVKIL